MVIDELKAGVEVRLHYECIIIVEKAKAGCKRNEFDQCSKD